MKIVVLAGGLSTERDVSLSTGTMVCNALRQYGHRAVLVDLFFGIEKLPDDMEAFFVSEGLLPARPVQKEAPDLDAVKKARPDGGMGEFGPNVIEACRAADIVFMALHGASGENGKIQAVFDVMGVKYTGSGYLGSALAMDKNISKQLFMHNGIKTPDGRMYRKGENVDFPLPCIVKPCSGGSSIGVQKAFSQPELDAALKDAFRYEDFVLVETCISGREFTCGILGGRALPPAEVIPKDGFYDYKHKYQDGWITEVCPAQISAELTERIQNVSMRAFLCLNLSVYARMDFLYDENGNLWCLEANTLPGMTPTSHLPQEAKAVGISYGALCEKIIEFSLENYKLS